MTAAFATQRDPLVESRRARWLRALPRRSSRSTLPVVATSAVVVVVFVQLLIGVALANGAYEAERLESVRIQEQRNLTAAGGALVRVQSPQYLANNAAALGMISNSNAVYLRLSDGAVFGTPTPADGATLAGTNVANSLLAGLPLVTDSRMDAASVSVPSSSSADAGARATSTGSRPGTRATPGVAAAANQNGSIASEGGIPAVNTR